MTALEPFAVTIQVFDPETGAVEAEHVLPVDSPDREHAIASTLANAASFTVKTIGSQARPVAFRAVKVEPRR